METTENKETIENLAFGGVEVKNLVGKEIKLNAFTVRVNEKLGVDITTKSEVFSCSYGPGSYSWATLLAFIAEDKSEFIEYLIKALIFPVAMRLNDIDSEYTEDILNAHKRLNERIGLK